MRFPKSYAAAWLIVPALCLADPPPSSAEDDHRIEALVNKGEELLAEGEAARARNAFRKALKRSGDASFGAASGLARAELARAKFEAAHAAIAHALDLAAGQNEKAFAYYLRGWIFYREPAGRGSAASENGTALDLASESFREALAVDGKTAPLGHYGLAEVFYLQGDLAEARNELERYLALAGPEVISDAAQLADCLEDVYPIEEEDRRITPPQALHVPAPRYPERARKLGVQGLVIVVGIVDENGRFTCPRVGKVLSNELTTEVLRSAQTWKFAPAQMEGRPIRVRHVLMTNFQVSPRHPTNF